jgi:pimeloyl-ACP methyl ester carboxylesterase
VTKERASRGRLLEVVLAASLVAKGPPAASAACGELPLRTGAFSLRGVPQTLHLYGPRGGKVVIVTSGDGGWVHLGPDVAEFLAGEGYRVVGFDAKAYLSSFTSKSGPLRVEDVPRDYETLVEYTMKDAPGRPLLVGVSEGAGLSVLAATATDVQARIAGVVALGLPDKNELGWRWRDSIIYITKQTPNEPTFSAREVVGRVAPVPLAALHSTRDEFVALPEIRGILSQAREPSRLWVVEAADHRFSDNRPEFQRRLKEAIAWIESQRSAAP